MIEKTPYSHDVSPKSYKFTLEKKGFPPTTKVVDLSDGLERYYVRDLPSGDDSNAILLSCIIPNGSMKRRIILFLILFILSASYVIADTTVNTTLGSQNDIPASVEMGNAESGEKYILALSPYNLAQLPPIFYGETDLPAGEELTITISKFPFGDLIVSDIISVLDKDEETKPFFTTSTEGMNKWFFIGNIDDFSFGAYRVNISAISEDICDENVFKIK